MGYVIPEKVKNNAKEGLRLVNVWERGGTEVGRKTARTLATGFSLAFPIVKKISEYFPRHAGDNLEENGKDGKPPSNGYIAWMLWGGTEGWEWSQTVVEKRREEDERRRVK